MRNFAIIFIFLFSITAFSQTPLNQRVADNAYKSLEKSDTQLALDSVLQTFADFKVSRYAGLTWTAQPYTEKINVYQHSKLDILLSEFPKKSQAANYWTNWSKILTDGKFDQRKFFKNDRERLLLANFNQLVLSAHEFGHHLDYFYNINSYGNAGGVSNVTETPLNCTEGFADQIAFVFVTHLAQDRRFAQLRQRYLELISEFNRLIAEKNRASFSGISTVLEDCGKINYAEDLTNFNPVENNEDFRRYVSIYFNRWQIMLTAKEFPSIESFIETRIFQPFYRNLKLSDAPVSVKTVNEVSIPAAKYQEKDGVYSVNQPLLNKNGELRNFVSNFKTVKEIRDSFDFENWHSGEIQIQNEKSEPIAKINLTLPEKYRLPFVPFFLAVDDDEFYLWLTPDMLNWDKEMQKKCEVRLLYQFRRVNNVWQEKLEIFESENFSCDDDQFLVSSPNGKFYLLNFEGETPFGRLSDSTSGQNIEIFLTEINRETLKLSEPKPFGTFKFSDFPKLSMYYNSPLMTDDGRLLMRFAYNATFSAYSSNIAEFKPNGEIGTLAGTVVGFADGDDNRQIKFSNISAIRQIDENTIRVIDTNKKGKTLMREIKLR